MMRVGWICLVAALLVGVTVMTHCNRAEGPHEELSVFHAGSLSMPVRELAALFEEAHPNVRVRAEAAGSRLCARKIADLAKPCDVLMSADARVVVDLLMPTHARFNIHFATNEMVIAYRDRSVLAGVIDLYNWPIILARPGVVIGRSDPDSDPAGYRALHVFQLTGRALARPDLAEQLAGQRTVLRPKSTDLLALLGAGEIDYLLTYRSVAMQHGLSMIRLPAELNLSSPAMAEAYRRASVQLTGKRPGQTITRRGEPIVYSVTIPAGAPNPSAAQAWVALLLSEAGREVMERNGQPCLTPPLADGYDQLPSRLRGLCVPRDN